MKTKTKYLKKTLIFLPLILTLILSSSITAQQKKPDVPYVPTPENVVADMLRMAEVSKDDVLYDLGCGDGRIVITAAVEYGCRGVGIDIDPVRIKESRENARKAGVSDRVQFILMDLFEVDLKEATVVTLYLLPRINLQLRPKLLQELVPGTRIVSHEFNMGDWEADATHEIETEDYRDIYQEDPWDLYQFYDSIRHMIYFWIIPADVGGTWTISLRDKTLKDPSSLTLKLDQQFQKIKGEAFVKALSLPLTFKDNKIKGDKLQFSLERDRAGQTERMLFEGTVQGDRMEGTLKVEGIPGQDNIRWSAKRNSQIRRKQ